MKPLAILLIVAAIVAPASAQTPPHVALFAAGSLKGALMEITRAFTARTGIVVDATYGSSGTLRTQIENGAKADLFASADLASPQALHAEKLSGDVTVFTRNRMCLLAKTAVAGARGPAEIMLNPAVRLITSTPHADPAGDYAEAIFAKIDAARAGSLAALDAKSLRLFGGTDAVAIPPGADLGTYLLLTADRGDALLAYCSSSAATIAANRAALRSIELPASLAVRADYGLTLRNGAPPEAAALRDAILSTAGQATLVHDGFSSL